MNSSAARKPTQNPPPEGISNRGCNASHLDLARKLEEAVKQRLERADILTDNGVRCVLAVAEAAQTIARLALGVSTQNLHTSYDPFAEMSDKELASELERLGFEPTLQ